MPAMLIKPGFVSAVALCLAGCAGHQAMAPDSSATATALPNSLPTYSYPLSGGDKLRVAVFGAPQLGGDFTVNGAGTIALPLIGEVEVKGLTSTQLQERIAKELADGYVKQPKVSVEVLNTRPYYILGEVNKPGEYAFADGLTIEAAVAQAGGYTYRAKTKEVTIKHASETTASRYPVTPSTAVAPGDTIRVQERWF